MSKKADQFRDNEYYKIAHQASRDTNHPAMQILLKETLKAKKVIDLGCGEGTRLNVVDINSQNKNIQYQGVDVSLVAIKDAKKKYPQYKFMQANLEDLPLEDNSFDLVFSAYVFEHLENPDQVLKEAERIVDKNGEVLIIAPNYGAPNRRSPNSLENKLKKLLDGFISDIRLIFSKSEKLSWKEVAPLYDSYIIDADTTVEPYLGSLIRVFKNKGFIIKKSSSCWEVDSYSSFQILFKFLGKMNLYPFSNWGPHLVIVAKKV